MKKIDSNKNVLLFKMSIVALSIIPLFAHATIINDGNIGNYTNTGIKAFGSSSEIEIQTTSATAPHLKLNSGSAITAEQSGKLTIGKEGSIDKFIIQGNAIGSSRNFFGVYAIASGQITANNELEISMQDGRGIFLANEGHGTFQQKVSIKGTGKGTGKSAGDTSFLGILAYNESATSNTTGEFNKEVVITSSGPDAYGIATSRSGNNPLGSRLTFADKVTIGLSGENSYGIAVMGSYSTEGDIIWLKNGVDLTTVNGTSIVMWGRVNDQLIIDSGINENKIISNNHQQQNAVDAVAGELTINGKTYIEGDIKARGNQAGKGTINLNLTDGSKLLSYIENNKTSSNPEQKGNINLAIKGSNSQWKMTNDSNIDSLTLSDDAQVIFGHSYENTDKPTALNGINAMTLTTDSLAGNGSFVMRTAIGKNIANDKLHITGSGKATGKHKIYINDEGAGAAAVTGNEKIAIVETEGGDAEFTLHSSSVDVGAYQYTLGGADNNWVLSSRSGGKPQLTNTAQNAANILNANYLMNFVETQTLLQRMGEIREHKTSSGDAWGRIYTGKLSSFSDKRLSGFDMDYYGLQLGIDRKLDKNKQDIYYGIMGGVSKGDVDHNIGDGNTKSYSVALYSTLQSQTGFYIDGLVKYMHMTNKFNSVTGGGYRVKGDGNTNGFSISAEIGKRFHLSSATQHELDQGWYLEPQAQVTYSHQNGTTINATNGLNTRLNSYNSFIGRASIILGYTLQDSKNPIDIYFKTGYLKEFDGETSYVFNHVAKEKYDFGGNWWDNGIGINMRLNKKHNIYGDMVYSLGNKFDRKQVNVGYRYEF